MPRLVRGLLPLTVFVLVFGGLGRQRAESAEQPTSRREPHIGYVYPAGGRQGTKVRVRVGGQFLRGILGARVSGKGVTSAVVTYVPPPRNLDGPQRRLLTKRLQAAAARRLGVATGAKAPRKASVKTPPAPPPAKKETDPKKKARAERKARAAEKAKAKKKARDEAKKKGKDKKKDKDKQKDKGAEEKKEVTLPKHPFLEDLESKSLRELNDIARFFLVRINPLQRKRSIAESVLVDITIAPDARGGFRELRLETRQGISNPLRFCVGVAPEFLEFEPLRPEWKREEILDLPVVLNGQILPRDSDRYRFRAKKGQHLVFRTQARSLVPFQADSVPGWMQATLTVFDAEGEELAFADEYRYDPDPVLFFNVPKDGVYDLEVRDAVSRGRDDFVYRVTIGEFPFVTRIFPLGGRQGTLTMAKVAGWNLEWDRLPLDTGSGRLGLHETAWGYGAGLTNEVTYSVDDLPEALEQEPNDDRERAQEVQLPLIVNGRIDRPGDRDVFAFDGRGGAQVVVEVKARVLGSPMDSVIRLFNEKGEVVAWNDDHVPEGLTLRGLGLQTHHADSYLMTKLPRKGRYFVQVGDVTDHGGAAYAYRVRISKPRPDVELFVTPSSINVPAGRAALIAIHAIRKDGFDEEIEIELQDAPEGFEAEGTLIPAGKDKTWMTLSAPRHGLLRPLPLHLVGRTRLGRETVTLPVTPADDVMQAFLWRHLVPAQELMLAVQGSGGRIPRVSLYTEEPVRVPIGGKARARLLVQGRVPVAALQFEIIAPPKGISIGEIKPKGSGFTVEIKASREALRTGEVENLIVEAFSVWKTKPKKAKKGKKKVPGRSGRRSLGLLPAIPYMVVRR